MKCRHCGEFVFFEDHGCQGDEATATVTADECEYCGEGPAGEFELHDGHPICEGCREELDDEVT